METVNFLAELWGFSIIIMGMALLVNKKNIQGFLHLAEQEDILPLIGVINVVLGVALILFYNTWGQSWTTIVTVLGWVVLIRGCVVLFIPDVIKKVVHFIRTKKDVVQFALVALVVLGCYLVYAGATF